MTDLITVSYTHLDVYKRQGHRIIAGLDIIRSLSELNGVSCPVFIDNSEAVNENNFPEMQSQMIHLTVTDDKELKVEEI